MTVGGQTLKVRAYSTTTASSAIPQPTGSWATADLVNYSGGFAVANRQPGDVVSEGSSPEHAVDNNGVVDVLVFELPQGQTWDLDQFRLGWADEAGVSRADVQAWFGGGGLGANYDFTKVCFTGCTALTDKTLTQLGIVQVGINGSAVGEDILPGSTFSSNVNFSGITPTGTEAKAGNYLIMTGQLGETNDAFKVQMLKATTHVPTPGTFALIGLGLFGLVTLRRRPVFA